MIPIVIISGSSVSSDQVGWTAMNCACCKNLQPFQCFRLTETGSVYFIETSQQDLGFVVVCDFCGSAFSLSYSEMPKTVLAWNRGNGLVDLVSRTNPSHLPLAPRLRPTYDELLGLLVSANRIGRNFGAPVGGNFWLGVIVSALVGGGFCAVLAKAKILGGVDAFGWGFLGGLISGLVGGIGWHVIGGRLDGRNNMVKTIQHAMRNYNVDLHSLKSTLQRTPERLSIVRGVIEKRPELLKTGNSR